MSINTNPTQKSPQRAFSLQKYLLLHSQQDALQKHIETILNTYSKSRSSSSSPDRDSLSIQRKNSLSASTPPTNPYTHTHLKNRRSSHHSRPSSSLSSLSSSSSSSDASNDGEKRRLSLSAPISTSPPSSPTLTSFPDPSTLQELSIEQSKLKDVKLRIKTTLTELLNSEGMKSDAKFRVWVQSCLMDVERDLRDRKS